MESGVLAQQARNNSKEQFANSPDFMPRLIDAIIDSAVAHASLSRQALESERVRVGLKEVLLGPVQLYERLREKAQPGDVAA